ncbi:MAG: segregation/condensation protein A [Halobacteriovoraceae bacterium]|jgi:segregation and condensation protein A|nr:segregation/condensation protein A [Halobacteriovoraceae bacterium]MBT5096103.1 segregation/condensation protein A [Halobacteriovoraceae bacterium]
MLDTSIQVKLENFDGPLGLLLLLMQKEDMSIRELDLTKITKQYLDYLSQMRELNFDVAGDYLYLASTLLLLKSKSCVTEEEMTNIQGELNGELKITSQAELIRRLEELHHFQRMGQALWDLPKKGHEVFVKPRINRKVIIDSILTPIELEKLTEVMIDFMRREKRKFTVIKRDRISIKEKLVFLKKYLKIGEKTEFGSLIDAEGGKDLDNVVITFISLLELARLNRLEIFQNENYSKIYITVTKPLEDFDVEQADGFEDENAAELRAEAELTEQLNQQANREVGAQESNDSTLLQ